MSLYDGGLYAQSGGAIIQVPDVDYPVVGQVVTGFNTVSELVENNVTNKVNGYLGLEGMTLQLLHVFILILVMYLIYLIFSAVLGGIWLLFGSDEGGKTPSQKRRAKKRGGKKKRSKPKKKRRRRKKKKRRRRKKKKSGFLGMVSSFLGFEGVPGRAIDLVDHHPNGFEGNAMGSGTAPGHLMNLYDRDPNGFEGNTDSDSDSDSDSDDDDEGFSSFMAARETPYFSEVPNYSLELERRERVARNELANMNRKNMSSNKPLVKWETHWNEWQQNNPMDGFEGNSPEDSLQY